MPACHMPTAQPSLKPTGIYRHETGELIAEKTLRVELMMVEQSVVRRIVDTIKATLNQESIAVQEQEILSVLW